MKSENLFHQSSSVIFMLHRVGNRDTSRLEPNESMKVSAAFLQRFIVDFKKSGFEFTSLDGIWTRMADGDLPEGQVALVFDDGYLDNFTAAYPILKAHQVPFCVYITPGLTSGTTRLWWFHLEDLLLRSEHLSGPSGEDIPCSDKAAKTAAFFYLRDQLLSSESAKHTRAFSWLNEQKAISSPSMNTRILMSWDEVRTLAKDPLVTIGAHTLTHPVLTALPDSAARNEISHSKKIIENEIGREVLHLAYPFGIAGEREYLMAIEAGFRTAVTTEPRALRAKDLKTLTALPRHELSAKKKPVAKKVVAKEKTGG